MTERPILFSGPMVRAILAGRKTQTRRVVKPQPLVGDGGCWFPEPPQKPTSRARHYANEAHMRRGLPLDFQFYGAPGDRLWVKETWQPRASARAVGWEVTYAADGSVFFHDVDRVPGSWKFPKAAAIGWVTPLFMPRWASRLTLEVTGVRVERLNAISEEDAKAEGVERFDTGWRDYSSERPGEPTGACFAEARDSFRTLWESINGEGSWESNPWVWVVDFRRATP